MPDHRPPTDPKDQPVCRVLLVEDSAADARLIREYLREGAETRYMVAEATSLAQARHRLAEEPIDIVLLDLGLPDSTGVETLARLLEVGTGLPVLVLTGLDDQATGVRAMQAGAQDYLVKGQLDGGLLVRTLRHARERHRGQQRLRLLAELGRSLSSTLDRRETLHTIARGATRLMDAPVASLWLPNADRSVLVLESVADEDARPPFPDREVPCGQGVIGQAAVTHDMAHIENVVADHDVAIATWARQRELRSVLTMPLVVNGALAAVLAIWNRQPFSLGASERALLEGFAAQAAIALGNARLFEEITLRRRAADALAQLGRILAATPRPQDVAAALPQGLRRLASAPVAAFYAMDQEAGDLVLAGQSTEQGASFDWPHRLPVLPADVAETRLLGTACTTVAAPLLVGERVLGALLVGAPAGRRFLPAHLAAVRAFAQQAAMTLDNAALQEHYRALFEGNLAGIFVTALDGEVLDCNDAFARLLGHGTSAEVVGADARTFYADPAAREISLDRLRRERVVSAAELCWRRRDGSIVWVLATARLLYDTGRTRIEGVVIDVTDRKLAERATREAEALRRVAQLANTAGHEINSPLTVILSRLELLAARCGSDEAVMHHVEPAINACRRIRDIVVRMGHITRLEEDTSSFSLPSMLDLGRSARVGGDEEPE